MIEKLGYATHVEERFPGPSDLAGDVQARERWILIGRKRDVALVPFDPKTEFNRTPTPMESILDDPRLLYTHCSPLFSTFLP